MTENKTTIFIYLKNEQFFSIFQETPTLSFLKNKQ